jgi:phosphoribosylaminoimidazole-succinocarboxamide synthase
MNKVKKIKKESMIYEGHEKIIYSTDDEEKLIMHFKDDVYYDNLDKTIIESGKGVLTNRISEFLMTRLSEIGIPTHYIETINMREQLVKCGIPYAFKVVVNNVAKGEICKRLQMEEGVVLPNPIVEFYSSNKDGTFLITEDHLASFRVADKYELEEIKLYTYRCNDYLCGIFNAIGIRLVSANFTFAKLPNNPFENMMIIDEISPDTCKLWDLKTNEVLDKESYMADEDSIMKNYKMIAKKLNLV